MRGEGGGQRPLLPRPLIRPGEAGPGTKRKVVLAGAVSLLAWVALQWISPPASIPWSPPMRKAAQEMAAGLERVAEFCREQGISSDPVLDPGETCLIGPQLTELFTTHGQLPAKRTSLNPDLAALMVLLLEEAGVEEGDTVAVGASGSFPALLLATLVAVRALDSRAFTILSLGSSSYGATRPEFHLLDLHEFLRREGVVQDAPLAVSLGGTGDVGAEFDEPFREQLREEVRLATLPLIEEEELARNVQLRMGLYGRPAAFVNIGGADANIGVSPRVLELAPGVVSPPPGPSTSAYPPVPQRGVLYEMLAQGIPVIHLLNLRALSLRFGVPWDPIPLPPPGSTPLTDRQARPGWPFWTLSLIYLGMLVGIALFSRGRVRGT